MFRLVNLENAQVGMTLYRAVHGTDGALLAGKGQELNKKLIRRLESLGVGCIWIEGTDQYDHDTFSEKKALLDKRFENVLCDPLMSMVYKKLLERLESRLEPDDAGRP